MLWPPIVKILSENLNNEAFVKANLYVTAAAHISTIMLYLYVPLCLKFMEWRVVFYTAAALAFAVGVALVFGVKNAVNEGLRNTVSISDADIPKLPFVKVIFGAGIIPIFMAIIPMGFLRDGIETWLPTLYSEAFGRDSSESVLLAVLMPVFAIAMVYITTALHKRTLFKNEILGSLITFGISAVTAFVMSGFIGSETVGGRIVCLLLAVIVSGLMHGCNFLLISCLPGRFARYHRAATTSGVCNACVYIGAAVSMYGIPAVESAFSWRGVVISWVIVAAVGGCAALIALKKYSSFIKVDF
jgi:OPA family glycerol-3-phosphate transporter-like MFS transporter